MKVTLNSIQDLRGFAVLYVLLFHSGNIFGYHIFIHGHTGVNLFFVISGFIISYVHKEDKGLEKGIIFAKKRVARIYSPYILPFLTMLILFLVSGKGSEFHRDIVNIVRNLFLVQNPLHSIHTFSWSLVYEMYYYATFLLVVIFLRRSLIQYCVLMSLPVLIAIFHPGIEGTLDNVPLRFYNMYFIAGALSGHFYKPGMFVFRKYHFLLAATIFLMTPFLTANPWPLLIATAVFFLVTLYTDHSTRVMRFVGNASYSLYLIHAPVLAVLKNVIHERSFTWFLVFLSACIILGSLYYVHVEKRLISIAYKWLRLGKHRPKRPVQNET